MNTYNSDMRHNVTNILSKIRAEFVATRTRGILMLLALLCISNAAWAQEPNLTVWDGTDYSNTGVKFADNAFAAENLTVDGHDGKSWEKAYVITTARQLAYFAWIVKNNKTGRGSNYYWKLGASINLGGHNWVFGGNAGGAFQGHFDGQNHTISNLKLDVTTNSNYGLLTTIQGANTTTQLAEVKNLNISGVTFSSTTSRANNTRLGALTGYAKQANISNITVSNVTFTYSAASPVTNTNQLGGAIGCMENNTTLSNVDVTGVTATFSNTTTGLYVGGVVGASTGTANTNSMTNCDVKSVKVTHSSNVTNTTRIGGLVGDANTSLSVINNNSVTGQAGVNDGKAFDVSIAGTTMNLYVGGLLGYTIGDGHEIKGNRVEKVYVTTTGTETMNRMGGLIGYAQSSGTTGYVLIKNNTATDIHLTADGNTLKVSSTEGNIYAGGLIGIAQGKASPDNRTIIVGNTVTNSNITMNGEHNISTLYLGGFLGYCETHTNVLNNQVSNPKLSITNNINSNAYVGGAVGQQATYTLIDGMTISGGTITGPASDKTIKNSTNFFVGGFLGMQNSSGTDNYKPNKFKNIAVSGIAINLEHYVPAAQITNHKFGVGGIAGSVNAPNQDALGNRGMPENLISKGVKIYAPWAMTSPTVPNFNGSAMLHNTMTPDAVTTVDALEKSKVASWLYSDYKLGLSSAITSGDKVTAQDADPQQFKFRKNYSQTPAADGGVDYLVFDDSHNDDVLVRNNRYLDSERDSKTVLWWTNQGSKDLSQSKDAAATLWTPNEQPLYPQTSATVAQAGNMTDYPYYMYFFQGISNATYTSTANADKIIAGIAANMAEAAKEHPVTLTITNNKEDERGFDERIITVAATTTDAEGNEITASGITGYQWYVNGELSSTSSSSLSLIPHWKLGQGITVNALNGETVVATATYTLAPGVLKTRASVADPTAEKALSDINGRGTASNPYIIDHENALRQLSYLSTAHTNIRWEGTVNPVAPFPTNQPQGHYNRAYYELGADITLNTSEPFTPISHMGYSNNGTWGSYTQNFIFQGHFDGKGHKISGLRITWGAGQYNENVHVYHGLFGALGNPTATPKWGETTTSSTVVKNLAIDDAILKHDVNNTSFKYYNNTKYNYCYVGVLAGIVGSNTTVQNIEIRNSSITDEGSLDYDLATKGLYVGGAIGSMQSAFSDQDNCPVAIQVEHIAAQVDITLTHPLFSDATNAGQLNQINVGGIIGRFRATNKSTATFDAVQSLMPKYTLYSGTINAPKAWISPVMASLGYVDQNGNSFANYSKQWEGNNNTAATQITIDNAQYYNYYIGSNKITESYPANVCGWGTRSVDAHVDANSKETAQAYRASKYQGVNYDATYIDQQGTSLALLNKEQTDGFSWVWDTTGEKPFVHLSTAPYVEVSLARDGNNFTANLTGATPQSYQWKVSFDGEHWAEVSTEQNYTAPASLKTKYVQAVVTDDQSHEYRTFIDKVERDESLVDPKITREKRGDNTVFTFNLNPKAGAEGQFTVTYEWYRTAQQAFSEPAQIEQTLTLNPTQLAAQKGVVWCKATIKEHSLYVTEFFPINGATVIYVNNQNTIYYKDGEGKLTTTVSGEAVTANGDDTNNNGLSPTTPVKTIDKANSLLKTAADGGTVDNNIIVIIGEHTDQFRSTGSNPATLTGKYDNTDYNGVIYIKQTTGEDQANTAYQPGQTGFHNYVLADTKFEYLTFKADAAGDRGNNFIECHGNDVTFGKGLVMTDFRRLSKAHGNFRGEAVIPEFTVVLTATNLSNEDINRITQKIHDKGKPQVVTFQSGHYGRIMGGRYTNDFFLKEGNTSHTILGSAEKPIWAVVNIDIDNDNPNKGKILTNEDDAAGKDNEDKTDAYTYDINAVIAGLTDGSMYGDYTINFHGGKVSYIVGGNQGNPVPNGTLDFKPEGGVLGTSSDKKVEWGQWPNASYFGRTVINVEQDNSLKTIDVGDLYAGGLGRQANGDNAKSIVDMYYYGHTEVNMKSGQVGNVYGGGAGGVMGVNPWDAHLPYVTMTEGVVENNAIINKVQYGDNRFGSWSTLVHGTAPMAKVTLHNLNDAGSYTTEQYDLSNSSTTVNISGGTVNGNVYGGGYGYVADMPDGVAMQGIGSLFGTSNINISGGTVTGNVYGGSRGHSQYLNKTNFYGQTITHIAEMNGTVNLNISGTEELYPTINGNIFGAGQGLNTVTRAATDDDVKAGFGTTKGEMITLEFVDIARTGDIDLGGATPDKYKTTVNITIDLPESKPFNGSVYGGGEMGKVDGITNVVIKNGGFTKHIYGAGLGEVGHAEKAKVTGSTYITFENGKLERTLSGETVVGGNIYGGGNMAKVTDYTNVTMAGGKVQGDVYGGGDRGLVQIKANVTLNGGEVYSNVFGGGNKAVVGTAKANLAKGTDETEEAFAARQAAWADTYGTTVTMNSKDAYVYGDIFGGGNQADIEGNTSVSLYAGNFGGNIFGGGNGLLYNEGTVNVSANVTGNTYIYIAEDEGGQDKETKVDNFNTNVIWNKKWDAGRTEFLTWDENKASFYNGKFLDNHNIYGGGNLACRVGTYDNTAIDVTSKPAENTGNATVKVFKGMTPFNLLLTQEWKDSYNDNNNPHFYVFGGGYGKNTVVGSTDVTVSVDGEYGEYTAEVDDHEEQLARPMRSNADSPNLLPVFDNSKGIPNFTVLGVLGGGYAGLVANNSSVTVGGKTFLHRVYGGGFGDPNSTIDNTTGQVGGNAQVTVNGAHTYGDVFGGGAGVVSTSVDLDNVARVLGNVSVSIADDAHIYGNVYGGGDMACVGVPATNENPRDYATRPSSVSSSSSDATWSYSHSNHQTFVNILGGDIFGEVYGGGKGVVKANANDYTKVGRVEGNTLVHIANSVPADEENSWVVTPEATQDAIVPNVWNRIYGGCAYGIVDGNTMVHVEGGMLGLNIFGGGYGDSPIVDDQTDASSGVSTASSTLEQVLGKKDTGNEGTYANVLGNTKVQIDGGSWIWNRKADTKGNITTWEDAAKQVVPDVEGFKTLVAQIQNATTVEELKKIDAVKSIDKNFFNLESRQFSKNHNIFGGGNRACVVGTYDNKGIDKNTGKSEVVINHSPIAKIDDGKGNIINMLDNTTVAGLCWYIGINNIAHPQFSVFGAGYGANTKVYDATVVAKPGSQLTTNGEINAPGQYLNEQSDLAAFYDYEQQIAEAWESVSNEDKKKYYGLADDDKNTRNTYLRYRASQMSWSAGAPNFTFMDIHGGGYSGYVEHDASVTADCQLTVRNIFGAGLGAKPYGLTAGTTQTDADRYDFGKVGGDASVFIKSGTVSLNVYGGGAGIESAAIGDGNKVIDFPNIARVMGKTNVDVYGEALSIGSSSDIPTDVQGKLMERTVIFGSVYGGGDVANVGTTAADEAVLTGANTETYTTQVNIRGGSIMSQIYAGGNGRLRNQCSISGTPKAPVYGYKNLGAVYGNTRLVVADADKTYPYETEEQKKTAPANVTPHMWNRLYGGCQNGTVYGNTLVLVNGGSLGHNIFGGGFGDDGTNFGHSSGDEYDTQNKGNSRAVAYMTSADVTGHTNIFINGGEMELTSFWHPDTRIWEPAPFYNQKLYSPQYDPEAQKFKINHNIYGGGNAACVVGGNSYINVTKGLLKKKTTTLPGDDTSADSFNFFASNEWMEVYKKVGSPHFAVFGGGYGDSTSVKNTYVNVVMNNNDDAISKIPNIEKGKEYLHCVPEQTVMDIVGGGYAGKVEESTNVTVANGTFARRVFGGGFYNSVEIANIQINAIDCDDIFGGGLMGDVLKTANVKVGTTDNDNTNANIYVHGNIYGGNDVSGYINLIDKAEGEDVEFKDNDGNGTNIVIRGGHIYGNVYGAGNGNYLYALDKKGNTKVTVNEHFKLNENDKDEFAELVYTVPMRSTMASPHSASDAQKIVNINSYRPLTNKVSIDLSGTSSKNKLVIDGNVFGGGNSATVLKADDGDGTMTGEVKFKIGNHMKINGVYLGSDGDQLFVTATENPFLRKFQTLNDLSLHDEVNWKTDPANHGISTAYLATPNDNRPEVYPHLLDLYFQPVAMTVQPTVAWDSSLSENSADVEIGTFVCGGNRGNMNVLPESNGNIVDITFPTGLVITNKIVGGCNKANYTYEMDNRKTVHVGGYLLGKSHTTDPVINLTVLNKFQPVVTGGYYDGGNVYGGCYETGTINGDVKIDFRSDMLNGKDRAKIAKANELSKPAFNVYGAGYGLESYVYGDVNVLFGSNTTHPASDSGSGSGSSNSRARTNGDPTPTPPSANFVFGGGQMGNVIGNTTVRILNGEVMKSVTGGSYSGYQWGSSQVLVGYPKYYRALKSGVYALNRADKWNTEKKNADNSEVIKSTIHILAGDIVSQQVYDAVKSCGTTEITSSNIAAYFGTAQQEAPAAYGLTWSNLDIKIGEAVYGGGYSLPAGSAVTANNTLVLKYTDGYNVNDNFTVDELTEINGSTTGFGGNSTIIVADQPVGDGSADHIAISSQDMNPVTLPEGTDLFGYYYKDKKGNYRYIYQEGTYYADGTLPSEINETYKSAYKYDGEGGIYGDGHLSYVEGFRNAEVCRYGFSSTKPTGARILNTFQRLDMLRVEDCSIALLGARDYTVNEVSTTPYSISRVGELQMVSKGVKTDTDDVLLGLDQPQSRNYIGLSNNIHYVGAITSDVNFNAQYRYGNKDNASHPKGTLGGDTETYRSVKQTYVDAYKNENTRSEAEFQKRNDGTAKNMIGISSGYALKIQNVYETVDNLGKKVENIFYGPIVGVVEMNLIDVREGEGGGYVYADNIHHRHGTHSSSKMRKVTPYTSEDVPDHYDGEEDFLETSGNFVFPYDEDKHRYIVDDCFPSKYYINHANGTGRADVATNENDDIHYWYVTGYNYYYNVHITGYTYDSSQNPIDFNSDNKDNLTILSGTKQNQKVTLKSVNWRSAHDSQYVCDIDGLNSEKTASLRTNDDYCLKMSASSSPTYSTSGVYLSTINRGISTLNPSPLEGTLDRDEASIAFCLTDKYNNSENKEAGYYEKHLSKPCFATVVLTADALDKNNNLQFDYVAITKFFTYDDATKKYSEVTSGSLDRNKKYYYKDKDLYVAVDYDSLMVQGSGNEYSKATGDIAYNGTYYDYTTRKYTYTIYLTIDYVKGPNVTGHININNCVLPGEMIKLTTEDIKFDSDQAFAPTGYYWRIGKLNAARTAFEGGDTWNVNATGDPGFDTYKVGSEEKVGVFKESIFNKTENALYIPAYYYMNGYGVQFGFTTNSLETMFAVASAMKTVGDKNVIADTLLVHNYHRMHPHNNQNPGMTLHLAEALARAKNEADFADPRIYIMDEQDLNAFAAFVDSIGTDGNGKVKIGTKTLDVPTLGEHGQFFLQNEIPPASYTAPANDFKGTFHGDGYSVNFSKLDKNNRYLFNALGNGANIYNLGIPTGVITKGDNRTANTKYHCCFTYDDKTVYRMNGDAVTTYTADDFRLGKVAYDLNQYYLDQRYVRGAGGDAASDAALYVENYYRNGDYQYARRQDSDTKNNTGIIYLRNGESDIPGYGTTDTHHDKHHTIDAPRAVGYVAANGETPESCTHFHPLFNENVLPESSATPATSVMNDYLFFGQSLQDGADLADYPTSITSHRVSAMKNRVWRAAGYYRSTDLDAYHYNAYNQNDGYMQTFVHDTKTTAINFDYAEGAYGKTKDGNIFYAPVKDVANVYYSFNPKSGVSKNLLVYTPADDDTSETDVYTKVNDALKYAETTQESNIKGHQVVVANSAATAKYLHLVERAVESAPNNDFCCPLAFNVTDRAWYTRKPANYAEASNDAWEGICLPFTANRVEASLNGEITHFYGTPATDAHAADNLNTLHHEYWLRGLTAVADGTDTYAGKKVGTFKRPGGTDLFTTGETISNYVFDNRWFVNTYDAKKYNSTDNTYYSSSHTYANYKPLTTGIPYIVSFPGYRFYEFDLSSKFYSEKYATSAPAQTVTFNAYGSAYPVDVNNKATDAVQIPVTTAIVTTDNGYSHTGTYLATENSTGIFSINEDGTAFKQGNGMVLPFRTYMTAAAGAGARTRAIGATDVIYIGGTPTEAISGYDEEAQSPEEALTGDYLILRPLSNHRIYVKSTYATTLMVYTASGQLYRVLDVKPGAATYSGFAPGIYVANKQKINVE